MKHVLRKEEFKVFNVDPDRPGGTMFINVARARG
jgi:hypothetical protein